jgi:hypothetical protein
MATTNRDMNDVIRRRRQEMVDLPAYEGPPSTDTETPKEDSPGKAFTVKAPGEPSDGESFEYEPSESTPGAWMVYPPGVPCDDTAYRITMGSPATAEDFAGMQEAIEDAGGGNAEPAVDDSGAGEGY